MWTEVERAIFKSMLSKVGTPYIWQGKGLFKWSPVGEIPMQTQGFDCSGLFSTGCFAAGLKDRRMSNNAQTWMDELEHYQPAIPLDVAVQNKPVVCFFGSAGKVGVPLHATHIALGVSMYGELWVVEASGGDETTTTPAAAASRGAYVRFGPLQRHDLIAYAKLPTA